MKMEKALTRLVQVARKTYCLSEQMDAMGYRDTPFHDIFGEVADIIYDLLGEETDTFDESVTYRALYENTLTNSERVSLLLEAIKEPAQK